MVNLRLKTYVKNKLAQSIIDMRMGLILRERALEELARMNMRKANYVVQLNSAWRNEGGADTMTRHYGSICDAVRKAEDEFKKQNKRDDVQADYMVSIEVRGVSILVPPEFWAKYKGKR